MFIISILSICTVAAFFPLGADSIDDLGLSWLPTGYYSEIMHVDLEGMKKAGTWEVYSKYMHFDKRPLMSGKLPITFQDYEKMTWATIEEYSIDKEWVKNLQNNTIFSLSTKRTSLLVYQFDYLEDMIGSALASGAMSETGEVFLDRKIYSYNKSGDRDASALLYGASSGMGEWLVADEVDLVKLMLACGYGSHPNSLMNDDIDEFIELTEDLGSWWIMSLHEKRRQAQMEAVSRYEKSKEYVDFMTEDAKQRPNYIVHAILLGEDEITEKTVYVFGEEEYAVSMKDPLFLDYEGPNKAMKRCEDYKNMKSVETIEGNKVIITYVLDEEMMRLEKEAAEEWEENRKKEQEEKAREEAKKPHAA